MARRGAMDCGVCYEGFNQNDHKPKILPCGHTFCSKCLLSLKQIHMGLVPCPICKNKEKILDVSQLITNYMIFAVSSVHQDKEKGPAVSAGHCDDHGEHKLFRCKSCDVWICHVCTVTEHPTGKCTIISIKNALREKKDEIRVQLQQGINESVKMLDRLENDESELQHDVHNQYTLGQEQIQAKCTELAKKVDNARKDLNEAKDQGLTVMKTFLELQDDLEGADKPQDVDVCAQKVFKIRARAREWMGGARENPSWKSGVLQMRNLLMVSRFIFELSKALDILSGDQIEVLISKISESVSTHYHDFSLAILGSISSVISELTVSERWLMEFLLSSVSVYVEVQVEDQPLFAQVSIHSTNSAVIGDLDSKIPTPEAYITQLADLTAKFSLMYVEAKTPEKQLYFPLVKDSKGCFWMKSQQDESPSSHRRHLLIPMKMLLEIGRVWFKHWISLRFAKVDLTLIFFSCEELSTCVRSFQSHHPPEGSFIMNADVVAMLSSRFYVMVRLEWDGKIQGVISIKLFGGAKRNVQFQKLCFGDDGHSYRKFRLLSVANRGRPGENVVWGDYDGVRERSLLPDLPPEEFTDRPVTAGRVASKPNSAQFVIYARDLPGATDPYGFGEVISGLYILEKALKVKDTRDIILSSFEYFWSF